MSYFNSYRTFDWLPTFEWTGLVFGVADKINLPHEDYPTRVGRTESSLLQIIEYFDPNNIPPITNDLLKFIHSKIFGDTDYRGKFRGVNVQVGNHIPPKHELVCKLMDQLFLLYEDKELNVDILKDWYFDFETIHPFQDGNGRVGGIIIASYSHLIYPDKGWMYEQA